MRKIRNRECEVSSIELNSLSPHIQIHFSSDLKIFFYFILFFVAVEIDKKEEDREGKLIFIS